MTPIRATFFPLFACAVVAFASAMSGCGSKPSGYDADSDSTGFGDDSTSSDDATTGDDGTSSLSTGDAAAFGVPASGDSSVATACTGGSGQLDCYVPSGCTTSLTGTVYDPAGKNPVYNAIVFVPDSTTGTLPKITPGTSSCSTCDASIGNYIAAATTDYKGNFTLTGVPATTHVPFVVQIGKWRREVFLPEVKGCADNVVPASYSRLPASQSEGDMPQMAILTGGADDLGCFMAGLGIASSEWTGPKGGGRLDVYQGVGGEGLTTGTAGSCSGTSCPLWSTKADLEYYDIVMLACEGGVNDQTKAAPAMQNMHDWLDEGGKVFATHYHYTWFKDGPSYGCPTCTDFVNTGDWLGSSSGSQDGTFTIDTTFLKGMVLQEWLSNLGQATGDSIQLDGVASSLGTVNMPAAQRWIYDPTNNQTKYMSILTPIGGAAPAGDASTEGTMPTYCGKAVFSDLHAGGSSIGSLFGTGTLPGSCNTTTSLTAQEAALEFLFFDLSACVADESMPPMIPPPSAQ